MPLQTGHTRIKHDDSAASTSSTGLCPETHRQFHATRSTSSRYCRLPLSVRLCYDDLKYFSV